MTTEGITQGRIHQLLDDRDDAYTRMRDAIPQLDTGTVGRDELSDAQRSRVDEFDWLSATLRTLREPIRA